VSWDEGFDAAVTRLINRRDLPPPPPRREPPVNPGPCGARCCKTPYGHAERVRECPCHPIGAFR
jgi:hypothetical protein